MRSTPVFVAVKHALEWQPSRLALCRSPNRLSVCECPVPASEIRQAVLTPRGSK